MVKVDVDHSVEVAWQAFEHRLTAELVELVTGRVLRVGVPTGRLQPSPIDLIFRARPATYLVAAHGSPPRGAGSLPARRPPPGVPATKVFRLGAEAALAGWTTGVLRDAYDVVHPSFLTVEHQGADEVVRTRVSGLVGSGVRATGGPGVQGTSVAGGEVASPPTTPDELDDLVERTIATVLSPVAQDEDGDIPIPGLNGTAYVRVRRDRPVVEVFAMLAKASNPASAMAQANARNIHSSAVTFVVIRDQVIARATVAGRPYQPSLVLAAVVEIMRVLDEAAEGGGDDVGSIDHAVHAGGRDLADEPSGTPAEQEDLSSAMQTLVQLDAAEPGSVSPGLAARIFDYNRDALLAGIHDAELQVIAWRDSGDDSRATDETEADVCADESASWQDTVDLLRAALRVAVER